MQKEGMKTFICTRDVVSAEGYQEFSLEAENIEQAREMFARDEGELSCSEVEVVALDEFDLERVYEDTQKEEMNWAEDGWFAKNHLTNVDAEFKSWWINFYGKSSEYEENHDYWVRCAFALFGWNANK